MFVLSGKSLIQRYKNAVSDRNRQYEAHLGFSASLPPDRLQTWEAMCSAWDADSFPKSVPNPFKTMDAGEFFVFAIESYSFID